MNHPKFGELKYDYGFCTKIDLEFFQEKQKLQVLFWAYEEEDGITPEQEASFENFLSYKAQKEAEAESLLKEFDGNQYLTRFCATSLLIQRDGGYAILCDDEEFPDEGIAIQLSPSKSVISQDEYL